MRKFKALTKNEIKTNIINSLIVPHSSISKPLLTKHLLNNKSLILEFFNASKANQKRLSKLISLEFNFDQIHLIYNLLLLVNKQLIVYNNENSNKIQVLSEFYLFSFAMKLTQL